MNQSAIALAADSAVTIGRGERIFDTANKLFTLSKYAPVGVMFYGNASLMELPWETAIKTFRADLGEQRFQTLEEYAVAFLGYLRSHVSWFPPNHQELNVRRVAQLVFIGIANQTAVQLGQAEGLAGRIKAAGSVTGAELTALTNVATRWQADAKNLPRLSTLSATFETNFGGAYQAILQQAREDVFGPTALGGVLEGLLDDVGLLRHTQRWFANDSSGIVVGGFGEGELFPQLRSYTVEYVVADEIRLFPGTDYAVGLDPAHAAFIVPFAQSEEMYSFVLGSNPNLQQHVHGAVERHLTELAREAALAAMGPSAAISPTLMAQLTNMVDQHVSQFDDELQQHRSERYLSPVYQAIRVLPKQDLASMAEALVSLASLRHKASIDYQTVGGPVDVAVISKGDGFIWINRKHYFQATLNPHFQANYYR